MILKPQTPYMLRNDGVICSCNNIHPYIVEHLNSNINIILKRLLNNKCLEWFYENTNSNNIKENIKQCIRIIGNTLYNNNGLSIKLKDISYLLNKYSIDLNGSENSIENMKEILYILNDKCNQEFCKIRTSGLKFREETDGIYFRISSIDFNWFPLIWKVIYDNRDNYSFVTIAPDGNARKNIRFPFYSINGISMKECPIEDFINLKGNPVIE